MIAWGMPCACYCLTATYSNYSAATTVTITQCTGTCRIVYYVPTREEELPKHKWQMWELELKATPRQMKRGFPAYKPSAKRAYRRACY